ncbi:glycogen debranching enzyme GlgX [Actinobacteria bacterium IMCC26207]|nr:glycogen debranching enzyme GlgX [Actinobacteria bacterium IMCC26207]
MTVRVWPGRPYPLGANWDGAGTNFSVFSEVAEGVELCLFDERGAELVVELPECVGSVWFGYLPDIGPGMRYGFRVRGPRRSVAELNLQSKLLLDPYAKAIAGSIQWDDAVDAEDALDTDSAPYVPRSVVINPWFDWGQDRSPQRPWHETVLYEAHVKGLTQLHPGVTEQHRGSYLGVCSPAIIEHLHNLGVTAIELMPVHQFVHDRRLVQMGLRNYWGYNSIGFFAPHNEYAVGGQAGEQVQEFKVMVKTLHEAGIEVILDVVYNHTAEGGRGGPLLSFKGLDNSAYYRLNQQDRSEYVDYTGTGNTLNMRHPHVLQLIMDSLRYWIEEMHVDGFRFDLAATLARELHEVDRLSAFFDLIQQDPVISQVKLIAEPWDVGEGGYQVGNFPPLWSEWNGRYRDCVRDVWRGQLGQLGEFAARLTGSSDLYQAEGRRPHASINFVTAHDGFTLADMVSYEHKLNQANGEDNRDGTDDNRSWNCGAEGPTDSPEVQQLRKRQQRNLLCTLVLSQGVPMLVAGDEIGRTQHGNNNGFAQDNEISWVNWSQADTELLEFTRHLIHLRQSNRVLQRRKFLTGRAVREGSQVDVAWFRSDGTEMDSGHWNDGGRSMGVWLNGDLDEVGPRGEQLQGSTLLLCFNLGDEELAWQLPGEQWGQHWLCRVDTEHAQARTTAYQANGSISLAARSVLVLEQYATEPAPSAASSSPA